MNTCDYKIGCQTQKREASMDLWTRATKLSNSRNGTSMKWIRTILGITGHVVDRSSLCKISEYGWMNIARNHIISTGPFCLVREFSIWRNAVVGYMLIACPMIRKPARALLTSQ